MHRYIVALACGLVLLPTAGCKVVKTAPAAQTGDPDDLLVAGIVADSYQAQLVPLISASAREAATLLPAIAAGLETAGAAYGLRGAGAGGSWTFAIKGTGKVVTEDRKSRAAQAAVDIDGDGAGDVTLQLGPVVKGTALRDIAPFYDFTGFRDQIQFAKLGRALNAAATAAITAAPLLGKTVAFEGAFALQQAADGILIAPTVLAVQP